MAAPSPKRKLDVKNIDVKYQALIEVEKGVKKGEITFLRYFIDF